MHFVRHTLHEFVYARYVLMTRWKNVKTKIFLQRKNCCLKLPENQNGHPVYLSQFFRIKLWNEDSEIWIIVKTVSIFHGCKHFLQLFIMHYSFVLPFNVDRSIKIEQQLDSTRLFTFKSSLTR